MIEPSQITSDSIAIICCIRLLTHSNEHVLHIGLEEVSPLEVVSMVRSLHPSDLKLQVAPRGQNYICIALLTLLKTRGDRHPREVRSTAAIFKFDETSIFTKLLR